MKRLSAIGLGLTVAVIGLAGTAAWAQKGRGSGPSPAARRLFRAAPSKRQPSKAVVKRIAEELREAHPRQRGPAEPRGDRAGSGDDEGQWWQWMGLPLQNWATKVLGVRKAALAQKHRSTMVALANTKAFGLDDLSYMALTEPSGQYMSASASETDGEINLLATAMGQLGQVDHKQSYGCVVLAFEAWATGRLQATAFFDYHFAMVNCATEGYPAGSPKASVYVHRNISHWPPDVTALGLMTHHAYDTTLVSMDAAEWTDEEPGQVAGKTDEVEDEDNGTFPWELPDDKSEVEEGGDVEMVIALFCDVQTMDPAGWSMATVASKLREIRVTINPLG